MNKSDATAPDHVASNQVIPPKEPVMLTVEEEATVDLMMTTGARCFLALSSELREKRPIIKQGLKWKPKTMIQMSYEDFFVLTHLPSTDYLTMSDVAKRIGFSTAAATGLVDKLEGLGFVERLHPAEDRRKIIVKLTEKGVAFLADMKTEVGRELYELRQDSPLE